MRRALERFSRAALKPVFSDARPVTDALSQTIGISWSPRSYSTDVENSSILEHPKTGREIHLLGCVHGSEENAADIRAKILDISPSTVVLPVCDFRYHSVINGTPVFPEELYSMVRSQASSLPAPMPISADQLSEVVKSWFRGIGFEPGIVVQTAAQTAQHKSATVVCGEPHVQQLLGEVQAAMGGIPDIRATLTQRLSSQMFAKEGAVAEFLAAAEDEGLPMSVGGLEFALKLEYVRTRRTARALVAVLRELVPEAVAVMMDRRDEEMTRRLLEAGGAPDGGPVVAVTGLMHLDGIERRCIESHLDSMYAQKYIG
eukprot:jgi/Ulvmu1/11752/UM008_0166.1